VRDVGLLLLSNRSLFERGCGTCESVFIHDGRRAVEDGGRSAMACALSMKTVMGLRMNLLISRWADITMSLLSLLIVAGGAGWDAEVGPQMLEAPALCFRLSTTREAI
jgi:hypothetical protein